MTHITLISYCYEIQVKMKTLKNRYLNSRQRKKTQDPEIKRLTQLILKCWCTDWSLLALPTPLTAPALTSTNDNGQLHFLATTAWHHVLSWDPLTAMTTLIVWQEPTHHIKPANKPQLCSSCVATESLTNLNNFFKETYNTLILIDR